MKPRTVTFFGVSTAAAFVALIAASPIVGAVASFGSTWS